MQTIIEAPDAKVIQEEHSGLLAQAKAVKVTNLLSHGLAKETLKALVMRKRAVKERLDPIIEAAHKAHKGLTSLRADLLAPIEQAEEYVSLECDGYETKEREKAEAEHRRLEAEARKIEEERKLREAVQAEAQGDNAAAAAILDEPIETPMVTVATKIAKADGESSRTSYSAECFDVLALAKHVVAHPEDAALLQANGPALNARARSQRDGFKLAGCRLKKDIVRSFRAI